MKATHPRGSLCRLQRPFLCAKQTSVERQRPDTTSNEIELYIRTYYSMLRSTGEVRVRSFEEVHAFSKSSLHPGARRARIDVSAFGYAAARLPLCMHEVKRIVLGQSEEQFGDFGYDVRSWPRVSSRGRRRPMRYDGKGVLAVFISSASDIDDLVPIVTAYQIEWNKMSTLLGGSEIGRRLAAGELSGREAHFVEELGGALGLASDRVNRLLEALGHSRMAALLAISSHRADLRMRLLAVSLSQYQTAAQRWWSGVEPVYLQGTRHRRPVYFVSSNTHSLANLLGGYALAHEDALVAMAQRDNPGGVWKELQRALAADPEEGANYLYFVLRQYLHTQQGVISDVQRWDSESGIFTVPDPGHVEVSAQVIDIAKLRPERFDPRLNVGGLERLRNSDALILNLDYPLGIASYHLLSRVGQGVGSIRGIFVMGKAATLNARVGDVMISSVVHDEHSKNTYVFKNAFAASDVAPYLRYGSVLDNQKVLTARSAFLQNRNYMGVFYREGYTVLEMESGPYMSAVYELVDPRRHPNDEIVYLGDRAPFPLGYLHYASDTPYSRRQQLLSKSLGYFGVDSTYGCSIAIVRRIFELELERLANRGVAHPGDA